MSQYRAWRGAVEFSGFPVQMSLYALVQGTRGKSFKQVTPNGNATRMPVVDAVTGEEFSRSDLGKGLEIDGTLVPLSAEALAFLDANTKTELATPYQFCPAATVRWDLATARYAVRADDKVPGSAQGLNILWNGLRSTGLAYVTQMSLRSGPDVILALEANEHGFWASAIPFDAALYDVPAHAFHEDERAQALFAQAVEAMHGDLIRPEFSHHEFSSNYVANYDAAVQAVLAGEPTVAAPAAKTAVPDLMAGLEAMVAGKQRIAATKKARSKKAVKA